MIIIIRNRNFVSRFLICFEQVPDNKNLKAIHLVNEVPKSNKSIAEYQGKI